MGDFTFTTCAYTLRHCKLNNFSKLTSGSETSFENPLMRCSTLSGIQRDTPSYPQPTANLTPLLFTFLITLSTCTLLTSLIWHFNAPVFCAVIGTLVAPARFPLLGFFVPNHPTSLAFLDPFHASVFFPPSRLLWRRNLPHRADVTGTTTQFNCCIFSRGREMTTELVS